MTVRITPCESKINNKLKTGNTTNVLKKDERIRYPIVNLRDEANAPLQAQNHEPYWFYESIRNLLVDILM